MVRDLINFICFLNAQVYGSYLSYDLKGGIYKDSLFRRSWNILKSIFLEIRFKIRKSHPIFPIISKEKLVIFYSFYIIKTGKSNVL